MENIYTKWDDIDKFYTTIGGLIFEVTKHDDNLTLHRPTFPCKNSTTKKPSKVSKNSYEQIYKEISGTILKKPIDLRQFRLNDDIDWNTSYIFSILVGRKYKK